MAKTKQIPKDKSPTTMYELVVRPFAEPFIELSYNTLPKVLLALASLVLMILTQLLELVNTPTQFWLGLMVLAVCDWIAGTFRALIDPKITWDWRRWGRSAYKLIVYPIALVCTSVIGNVYPYIFGWIQWVVVAILFGQEVYSVFRHFGLVTIISVVFKMAENKFDLDRGTIKKLFSQIDREIYEESYNEHVKRDSKN